MLAGYAEGRELSVDYLLEDGGVVEAALGDVGGDVEELAAQLGEGEAALGEVVQGDVGDVPRPQEGLEQGGRHALAAAACAGAEEEDGLLAAGVGGEEESSQLVEDILSVVWEDPLYEAVYGGTLGFGVPSGVDLDG